MNPDAERRSAAELDRGGATAIVFLVEAQALLLWLGWAWRDSPPFDDRGFQILWYSLVLLPPALVSLLLRRAADAYAWGCGAAVAGLVALLAWHTGGACGTEDAEPCFGIFMPYGAALTAAFFILLPFLQGFREHGRRLPYAGLFHDAWDNALVAAAAGAFTLAAWLILLLWSALFAVVGIEFFRELFRSENFIFPVTGLLAGFGIVLARSQSGALQSLLRVCLALGRGLLPLIGALALAFLATLVFTGLQPLWGTGSATALVLALVFGMVALVNAVVQDGAGAQAYRPALRRLLGAAVCTLPAYALIAAWSLGLRVEQHGWTVARLWAALLVSVAIAYAFAYAASALRRRAAGWLSGVAIANPLIALGLAALLLATQSPLLDFRAITIASQLQRLQDGRVSPAEFDYEYFRWELGRPGVEALARLREESGVVLEDPARRAIDSLLAARERWSGRTAPLAAGDLRLRPEGVEIPPGLLEAINEAKSGHPAPRECWRGGCYLVAADLVGDAAPEWLLVDPRARGWSAIPAYGLDAKGWRVVATLQGPDLVDEAFEAALERGAIATRPVTRRELVIGGKILEPVPIPAGR